MFTSVGGSVRVRMCEVARKLLTCLGLQQMAKDFTRVKDLEFSSALNCRAIDANEISSNKKRPLGNTFF